MIFNKLNENNTETKNKWDEFVFSSSFGHLFQSYEWGEVSRELGWEPLRFAAEENGSLKAIAQVLMRKKGPFSILYAPRGPVFNDRQSFVFLISNIKKVMRDNNALFLKINPAIKRPNEIEDWYKFANLVEFNIIRELHTRTYLIDLTKDLKVIWSRFDYAVRKSIKRAEIDNVTIEKVEDQEGFDIFYRIYEESFIKKGVIYHKYKFLNDVWHKFSGKGAVEIFLAKHSGRAVSGLLLLLYGNTCEEMLGCALDKYLNVRTSQLLHWRIFCWLKEKGYMAYNFGGIPIDKNELPGVQFYKKSFGGDLVDFLGEYDLVGNPILYYIWNKLNIIRRRKK